MQVPERIYSCDDHLDIWNLPRDLWESHLPTKYRERGPKVVAHGENDFWVADGAVLGASGIKLLGEYSATRRAGIDDDGFRPSDPKLRLEDMERDGIYASVIYGPNPLGLPIADAELKAACLAAYNDWAIEFNAYAHERLCALAVLPTHSAVAAVAELERVRKLGHRGAILSPFEARIKDAAWERLWAAAADLDVPLSFHIGHVISMVALAPRSWEMAAFASVCPIQLDEPLAIMIFSGALERHPRLKLVLAESGVGWLPYFVARMDEEAEKHVGHATDYRLRSKPSEIFRHQVLATFEEEPLGPKLIPLVGAESCMWASDYPHPDSTFPNSRRAIEKAFAGLDTQAIARMTSENCARLYRFAV